MENVKTRREFNLSLFLKIFFIASMIGLGVYIIVGITLALVSQNVNENILYVFTGNIPFSDFAETLSYAICPNPYTGEYGFNSIYPPLSFLIFYPFALICLGPLKEYIGGGISLDELSSNGLFIFSFILYYLINLAIIMYIFAKFTNLKGKNLFFLLGSVFAFGPLLFEFLRANNTLTTCILALLFFYLNSSEKRWKREVSYICLAGAICMKIYPALMIFYLIYKEKRWEKLFSLLKTLGYALILIFIPFLFIEGGFSNILVLWNNFRGFSGTSAESVKDIVSFFESLGPTQWTTNISIETVVFWFCQLLSVIFGGADMSVLHTLLSSLLRYGLLALAIILPFISFKSSKAKEFVLLAVATYLLFPGVCNGYCMTLMMIPFLFMIRDFDSMTYKDKIFHTVCYIIILNPFFYSFGVFLLSSIAVIVETVKAIVDIIAEDHKIFKEARKLKKGKNNENEEKNEVEENVKVSKLCKDLRKFYFSSKTFFVG